MKIELGRGQGACINILARARTLEDCSVFLYAIEMMPSPAEVLASISVDERYERRLKHLIASYGLLGRVRCGEMLYSDILVSWDTGFGNEARNAESRLGMGVRDKVRCLGKWHGDCKDIVDRREKTARKASALFSFAPNAKCELQRAAPTVNAEKERLGLVTAPLVIDGGRDSFTLHRRIAECLAYTHRHRF